MHLTVYEQSRIFYFAFLYGIIIGIYYDFYRLLRYLGFKSKSAVIAQDIIFMSTSAVLCFLFAEVTVNGHLRAFVAIAHFFGAVSYRYSLGMLSGFVFKFIGSVLNFIKTISKKILSEFLKIANKCAVKTVGIYNKIYCFFNKKSETVKKIETN